MKLLLLSTASLLVAISANGQRDWKNWDAINLTVSPTKNLDIRFSHLRSYELSDSFRNNFNQTSLQAEYTFKKKLSLMAGHMITQFPSSGTNTNREYARISYKLPLFGVASISNGVQGEMHSANENRFKYRVIYIGRFGLQKRLPVLRLAPSVSYWLYYNIGGSPIQYYDSKTGAKLVKQTPDGFHRSRLFLNLNSKITKFFSVNIYYVKQTEFNFLTDPLHEINVKNPATGKVARAFDSYNVAGISLAFDLNLYKKD